MTTERDYNLELADQADSKYAYNFDFDVMHPLMLRSFRPFFRPGNCLELGSFKGDFTRLLLPFFDNLTCVEASDQAIESAREQIGAKAIFVNSSLDRETPRVTITSFSPVLEHIDDPVPSSPINENGSRDGASSSSVRTPTHLHGRCVCGAHFTTRQFRGELPWASLPTPRTLGGTRRADSKWSSFRNLLQGAGEFSVGQAAQDGHHLEGIFGGLLQTGAALSRPVLEHFPVVRKGSARDLTEPCRATVSESRARIPARPHLRSVRDHTLSDARTPRIDVMPRIASACITDPVGKTTTRSATRLVFGSTSPACG